jgi:triosephosphate isomerase
MALPRPLIAGNWKMNGLHRDLAEIEDLVLRMTHAGDPGCDLMICPPATLITLAQQRVEAVAITIGGQDCHPAPSGAHTGDLSAEMLADAGARAVILGHSERRADHGETSALVRAKTQAAHRARLSAIVCVGETEAERDSGRTLDVVGAQLAESLPAACTPQDTVLAYEPIWAIGTGRTPRMAEITEVHGFLRQQLLARFGQEGRMMRILYGGSVKPGNAGEILPLDNVNGALVGGASLKADDFWGIVQACQTCRA